MNNGSGDAPSGGTLIFNTSSNFPNLGAPYSLTFAIQGGAQQTMTMNSSGVPTPTSVSLTLPAIPHNSTSGQILTIVVDTAGVSSSTSTTLNLQAGVSVTGNVGTNPISIPIIFSP